MKSLDQSISEIFSNLIDDPKSQISNVGLLAQKAGGDNLLL
jgi:hypothetical protein